MRNKKYMRRIPVGGLLGTVIKIRESSIDVKLNAEEISEDPKFFTPTFLELPRPASVTQVGQRVRVFAKPI